VAQTLDRGFISAFVEQSGVAVVMSEGRVYDVLKASDAAVVASGTATLETGLMGVPMVIIYRISAITYLILNRLVSGVKHVGLVNIVSDQRLVPELIQHDVTPENIANAVSPMLSDPAYREKITDGLAAMRTRLGGGGASARAAAVVRELMGKAG